MEKDDIENDLEGIKGKEKSKERYYTPPEFRDFRKRVKIKRNDTGKGIPQGSAISAVLANIYAIDLDQALNSYAKNFGGIYRRYSDDIILVLPMKQNVETEKHVDFIKQVVADNKVTMGEGKTSTLYYKNKKIYTDTEYLKESKMDYLGFAFDGATVKIREKSLFKYYHRMYKKIESINLGSKIKGRPVGRKKLYSLYTHLGNRYKGYGNFISYCKKAHKVFSEIADVESMIYRQIKRHWNKIQRRLL
ncbi:reverse transcriptase domain-containing protein [Neobacillus cucumis]|uniref:reverse transcriptase domain-containing protein n=1 Tax=Neobacillus cucumis TaxID=1740721 RepID=UPI002E21FAD1|nr:reverse transcriptase domain-containing protein [Neobacillus cucumis]